MRRSVLIPLLVLCAVFSGGATSAPATAEPARAATPGGAAAQALDGMGQRGPRFRRTAIDRELAGAAFGVVADLDGRGPRELVVSGFGTLEGTEISDGTVVAYTRGSKQKWTRRTVVPQRAGITFPNEVLVDDVDGDGDADVVVPGGFFICALAGRSCGSLTWWEQRGRRFRRHTLVAPGAPAFYHRVLLRDLDGDGRRDLLTVAETAASAHVEVYAGTDGPARFERTPTVLASGGGSLPILRDVDRDGDLDIVSGQYFDRSASFVWFERVDALEPAQRFGVWVRHVMAAGLGGVIQVLHVPGLGLVGSNHTNTTSGPPGTAESGLYLLRPRADPRLPWRTTLLSHGIVSRGDTALGQQQGAPGVLGYGDVDRDGDRDLVVSGDGDPRLFWLDRTGPQRFVTRVVRRGFGQAGGAAVIRRRHHSEVFFTSYDDNSVNLFRLR